MDIQPFIGLHHYALRSLDVASTAAFFEALGYRPVHNWALPDYEIALAVMMQAPDGKSWIELFDLQAAIPMQGRASVNDQDVVSGALTHICMSVSDLDAAMETILAAGATHLHGPQSLVLGEPQVAVRNAIFTGPGGVVIELLQDVRFPGDRF